jgi:hypothetical protein
VAPTPGVYVAYPVTWPSIVGFVRDLLVKVSTPVFVATLVSSALNSVSTVWRSVLRVAEDGLLELEYVESGNESEIDIFSGMKA